MTKPPNRRWALTRRSFLQKGGAMSVALALPGPLQGLLPTGVPSTPRPPGSLPLPKVSAGTPNDGMPFDHIICVMMENHSFDNLLGGLPLTGYRHADTLSFKHGRPTSHNPGPRGPVHGFAFESTAQGPDVTQTWNSTHAQIDGGRMDGFVRSNNNSSQPMGYYPARVLPFAYSLASTFTLANRWFCSAPCQTYPNRRFLMAGTAYGDITTDSQSLSDAPPPNGTIFDRLAEHGISWRNYFTDLPQTAIIPSVIEKYPSHITPITQFFADCAAGTLPAVSFVDPEFGALSDIGAPLAALPQLAGLSAKVQTVGGDQEEPQDMYYGEKWAHEVLEAVLRSPAWHRTLLIYTYDEHGGYYDHVAPHRAVAPDSIPPRLAAGDVAGGYTLYGPRVPAAVVSPYSKPRAATNVVHDHTSVLATIEHKWNLPALTHRDANAATVMDFLDVRRMAFAVPPRLKGPSPAGPSGPRT